MKSLVIILVSILIFSCSDDDKGTNNTSNLVPTDSLMIARVIDIFDGDTFDAIYEGRTHRVRVLNIDCYETSYGSRLSGQAEDNNISNDSALALGKAAKELAEEYLLGRNVTLFRDNSAPNTDIYGRLLRYVSVGGIKYDSLIIANGLDAN